MSKKSSRSKVRKPYLYIGAALALALCVCFFVLRQSDGAVSVTGGALDEPAVAIDIQESNSTEPIVNAELPQPGKDFVEVSGAGDVTTEPDAETALRNGSYAGSDNATAGSNDTTTTAQAQEPVVAKELAIVTFADAYVEIAEALDAAASKNNCVAVSLAVFDRDSGYFIYQYGYASLSSGKPVNQDTKFRVASLTKLVTAICALTLAEAGEIDLDGDISSYLGYSVRNPGHPGTPITCRMLMQHTSSIYDSNDYRSSRTGSAFKPVKQLLEEQQVYKQREPGALHEYSNFGVAVLGAVCEVVSGKSLDTLAREVLFEPLAIDAAYVPGNLQDTKSVASIYNESHSERYSAQAQLNVRESEERGRDHHLAPGYLTISALDYARIIMMLLGSGSLNGDAILTEGTVMQMHNADVQAEEFPYMQGLAVRYQENGFMDKNVYWHTGSAFGELTQFIYDYDSGFGVVVITTGAKENREPSGMIKVCSELSAIAWSMR